MSSSSYFTFSSQHSEKSLMPLWYQLFSLEVKKSSIESFNFSWLLNWERYGFSYFPDWALWPWNSNPSRRKKNSQFKPVKHKKLTFCHILLVRRGWYTYIHTYKYAGCVIGSISLNSWSLSWKELRIQNVWLILVMVGLGFMAYQPL